MDPTTLAVLLAAIPIAYDIAKEVVKAQLGKPDERKDAVDALTMAVGNTEAYLTHLRSDGQSIKIWEQRLSEDWKVAHRAVRDVLRPAYGTDDYKKLKILRMKSFYWRNPSSWSDADVEKARIGLSNIKSELSKFIDTDRLASAKDGNAKSATITSKAKSKGSTVKTVKRKKG